MFNTVHHDNSTLLLFLIYSNEINIVYCIQLVRVSHIPLIILKNIPYP